MTKMREALTYLRARRVTVDEFRRAFSDMLLMGLVSRGFVAQGERLSITNAGRRMLADA
jgi:hypothetical protein